VYDPFYVIVGASLVFSAVLLFARLYIRRRLPSVRQVRDEAGRIVAGYGELRSAIEREREERLEDVEELAGKMNALRRDVTPLIDDARRRGP